MRFSLLLFATGVIFAGDAVAPVPFPAEYRTWAVARSLVVGPESKSFANNGGFHHYHANEKAMQGFRTGQFPDGSVVVDERLEVRQEGGNTFEGPGKSVAVMEKHSARYQSTGGWGFDVFAGKTRNRALPLQSARPASRATASAKTMTSCSATSASEPPGTCYILFA